ncbi:hypothetical protein F2Q69_00039428 [Brassica cretica]|uniref:Uncharacterized protein n=1 Tax=Brassica cretica TaxID=69181 RepID=A0A8S9NAA4_BRACR|nr:hypothetical protein F2Q69_00039428 [Brassica cretica]
MSRGKYIVGALVGSAVVAYVCDKVISDDKIFGGKFTKQKQKLLMICVDKSSTNTIQQGSHSTHIHLRTRSNLIELYTFLETLLDVVVLLPSFIEFFSQAIKHSSSPSQLASLVLAFVLNLAFVLSLLCFIVMHLSLLSTNTTSVEVHEKSGDVRWKYDLGKKKNFEQVFGKKKAFWLLSLYSKDDLHNITSLQGLEFPTRSDIDP